MIFEEVVQGILVFPILVVLVFYTVVLYIVLKIFFLLLLRYSTNMCERKDPIHVFLLQYPNSHCSGR